MLKPQHILGGALALAVSIAVGGYALTHHDMTGEDWAAIEAYRAEHPRTTVTYELQITGGAEDLVLNHKSTAVTLTHIAQLDSLSDNADYLQGLSTIDLGTLVPTSQQLLQLYDNFPNAEILVQNLELLGKLYPADSTSIELPALTWEEFQQLPNELPAFRQLTDLTIADPAEGDAAYTFEPVALLGKAVPNVKIHMNFGLFGQMVSTDMERIEYFKADIGGDEGLDTIRAIMPAMHSLTYLKLDWCGTSDEATAALREELSDKCKVVWRIFVGSHNALTDTLKIWMNYANNKNIGPLKYCNEARYVDIGHADFTHCEFAAYMPDLEVLIMSDSQLKSVEPLRNCKKLTFLEFFWTYVSDLSPLAELTQLEYLNISHISANDLSPLYGLNNLKKLHVLSHHFSDEQIAEFKAAQPQCSAVFRYEGDPTHVGWRWDNNGKQTPRYALLRAQIGYDTVDRSRYPNGYVTEPITYESTGIDPVTGKKN